MLMSATLRESRDQTDVAGNSRGESMSSFHFNPYEKGFYIFELVVVKIFANCCLEKGF